MKEFIHPVHKVPVKLGKHKPRHDSRTLHLSKYNQKVQVPPASFAWNSKVPSWPMYLNDTEGDCVIAAAGHMIQQWTAYGNSEVTITDQDIQKGYEAVGGYVPGDPSTDNGCDMLTACNYWRKTGFGGHKIAAFVAVNTRDLQEVRQAIWLFGNCYFGVALPVSAQVEVGTLWDVPATGPNGDAQQGSWGGHCVPLIAYTSSQFECVTWATYQQMTNGFVKVYGDEAYAIISLDWIQSSGLSASGFDLATLQTDLSKL